MSHSHPATKQDEWVLDRIGAAGIFVEVGAYDGITHSNTLLLEQEGWVGTLIEGHEPFSVECRKNRPFCAVHHALIGSGGLELFVVGGQWSGIYDHMPEDFRAEHRLRGNQGYLKHSKTLAEVIGTPAIDYLSVDTEGGELVILERWLKAGGTAHAITVEFCYDMGLLHRLERLMGAHGMFLDEVRGFDACFLAEK